MPVPPGFRQVFPTAMPPRARHLRRVAPTDSLVANDLHGSEDRAKDVSSAGARDAMSISTSGAYAFNRACGQRSLPRHSSGRPMSSVGRPAGEETHYQPTDRPRPPFRRDPAKEHVFPETGTPFTVANARGETKRISPPRLLRVGLSLTPPTPFPEGKALLFGPCKHRETRSPASTAFERRAPFEPAGKLAPGTDDPSAPAWLGESEALRRLVASAGSCSARSA